MMLHASPSPFSSSASCATLRGALQSPQQISWPPPINNIPSVEEVHMLIAQQYYSNTASVEEAHVLIAQHYRELCQRESSKIAAMEAAGGPIVESGSSGGHHDEEDAQLEVKAGAGDGAGGSPIAQLKKLHGWITRGLIRESSSASAALGYRRQLAVLDMACGKGGDMGKWKEVAGGVAVGIYVGADVVGASLEHAKRRYATDGCSFPARLLCTDCFSPAFPAAVAAACGTSTGEGFDLCSCQFALHYAWSSARRARQALLNVSSLLRPGGLFIGTLPDSSRILHKLLESDHQPVTTTPGSPFNNNISTGQFVFGNSLFRLSFDPRSFSLALALSRGLLPVDHSFGIQYEFHLEDAVNHCPEWLVPFDTLVSLAHECGLRLLSQSNFHDFVREQLFHLHNNMNMQALPPSPSSSTSCPDSLVNHYEGTPELAELLHNISPEEWECASVYTTFVFQKCP